MTEEKQPGQDVATAKSPSKMTQLKTGLEMMAGELKTALPSNITAEKFISTAITGIRTSKDPKKLIDADRRSLYNAVQTAAAYGLILDGREAALVPFGDKVQFMPMVQGLVKMARNSGAISTIIAEVVYGKDNFSYRIGVDESPIHEPDWFADDRGEPVGVWALVTLTDGSKIHSIMPKRRVLEIASASANKGQYDPKTGKHFSEWWKKTAIKNVLKYAPKATELEKLERLAAYDDKTEGFVDTETGEIIEGAAPAEPKKRGTRASRAVKAAGSDAAAATMKAGVDEGLIGGDKGTTITDATYTESGTDDTGQDEGYFEEEEIPV
jgi:recombination protein RecT